MTPTRNRRIAAAPAPPVQPQGLLSRLLARWTNPSPVGPGIRFGGQLCYRDSPYAGASRTRKQLSNWQPERWHPDMELLPAQDLLVARSRDLDRNNGIASGSFQTLTDNTVGIGLRLAADPNFRALGRDMKWKEEWSRNVESLWQTWANTVACDVAGRMTFAAMTRLVFRSILQNGEALALPLWLDRPETPWRTCIQLVDSDRLSNPNFEMGSVALRGGIEFDDYGKPVAYHIQKNPTWSGLEFWYLTLNAGGIFAGRNLIEWERIEAETEWGRKRVLHIFEQERVDQSRGKPILTPVIEQFRMLDSYQRTELQSAIVNSLVAGVIETPMDPAGIAELMGGDANAYLATKGEYRPQLEGGTFIPLYPGDKLTPYVPNRPANTFPAFVETITRQIGAAMGLPYELVYKDFSKTNYSSARAALNEAWRAFIARRKWLSDYWCAPVYALWFEEAVNAGEIEAPGFYDAPHYYLRAKWIGPGRGYVDPTKEAQASQMRLDSYISTLEMECAEQGLDYEDVLDQRALELERMKLLGLTPPKPQSPQSPQTPPPAVDQNEGDGEQDGGDGGDGTAEADQPQSDQQEAA